MAYGDDDEDLQNALNLSKELYEKEEEALRRAINSSKRRTSSIDLETQFAISLSLTSEFNDDPPPVKRINTYLLMGLIQEKLLAEHRALLLQTRGDGNCLLNAFFRNNSLEEWFVMEVRNNLSEFLKKQKKYYLENVFHDDSPDTYDRYAESIKENGVFLNFACIVSLALLYKTRIALIIPRPPNDKSAPPHDAPLEDFVYDIVVIIPNADGTTIKREDRKDRENLKDRHSDLFFIFGGIKHPEENYRVICINGYGTNGNHYSMVIADIYEGAEPGLVDNFPDLREYYNNLRSCEHDKMIRSTNPLVQKQDIEGLYPIPGDEVNWAYHENFLNN
jgi:hypothetical protein